MLCFIALIIALFLSIFSAKYRAIAKEAFYCTINMITLRPCTASADSKLRSAITSSLIKRNKALARFVYKHFNALSLLFTILLFASLFYSFLALYNLVVYGTCDPQTGNCIITGLSNSLFNNSSCS